jgi:hypothetical protein
MLMLYDTDHTLALQQESKQESNKQGSFQAREKKRADAHLVGGWTRGLDIG